MSSVPSSSTTSKATSANNSNPSNTTINKGIKPRPSIVDFNYEPPKPVTTTSVTPTKDSYSTPTKSLKERSFTPIKSGSKDTTAVPSKSITPSKHLRSRSSSFSSPSQPVLPLPVKLLEAIPFNLNCDSLLADLKTAETSIASKRSKKAFKRAKPELTAESSSAPLQSKRSSRTLKKEDSALPILASSSSFRMPTLTEERAVSKPNSLERLKTKCSILLEKFFSEDKEEVRRILISMRCYALILQKKYAEKLDNKRKSIGLSTFETDDLAFDGTKSVVHMKIAEFFDEMFVKLSKDIKKDKDKLQKWLLIEHWEKPRALAVAKSYLESILEFKKWVKLGLDRQLKEEIVLNANTSTEIFTIETISKNNFFALCKVMKEGMDEIHMDQSEREREILVRYKEVLDNLNIYIDDLKSVIDQLAKKENSWRESIELKTSTVRKSVRKSRIGSFAPKSRQSLVTGESKVNYISYDENYLTILNKMAEEIEKLEKETSKKNKRPIISHILDQLNALTLTTETDFFTGLPKRSASEFGYMDIRHLLVEKKFHTSEQHDQIIKLIRKNLLNLKKTIPSDKPKKRSNEKVLFRWIGQDSLLKTPIATLAKYRVQLGKLILLLNNTKKKFYSDVFPSILTKEQIVEMSKESRTSEQVITIFNDINKSIFDTQTDLLVTTNNDIIQMNKLVGFTKRYPEIISILENYRDVKIESLMEYMRFQLPSQDTLLKSRREVCNSSQSGSTGALLSQIKKNPTKDTEWTYTFENAALTIVDGDSQDKLLFPEMVDDTFELPTIGDKSGEDLLTTYKKIQNAFHQLIDLSLEQLQIDAPSIETLLKVFGLKDESFEPLNPFADAEQLIEFLDQLGFTHHFNLENEILMNLYQYILKEGFIDTDDGRSKLVQIMQKEYLEISNAALLFNALKTIHVNARNDIASPYRRFDSFGQVLKLIAMDEGNLQKEEVERLIHLFQFVNQESAYANKNPIGALYFELTKSNVFKSYKGFKTSKNEEKDKISKKYQIQFTDTDVVRSATSIHTIVTDETTAPCLFYRERLKIESGKDHIHQSDEWKIDYSGTIIIKKQDLSDNQKRVLENLETVLDLLNIDYSIVYKV